MDDGTLISLSVCDTDEERVEMPKVFDPHTDEIAGLERKDAYAIR